MRANLISEEVRKEGQHQFKEHWIIMESSVRKLLHRDKEKKNLKCGKIKMKTYAELDSWTKL